MNQEKKTLYRYSVTEFFKSVLSYPSDRTGTLEGSSDCLKQRLFQLLKDVMESDKDSLAGSGLYGEIEKIIDDNKVLSSYIFFLESNERFNYTCSYLLEHVVKFKNFIYKACVFIRQFVNDVNAAKGVLALSPDVVVVFQNFIRVRCGNVQQVETEIEWRNFGQIIKAVEEYIITIEYKKTKFLTFIRRYSEQSDKAFQVFLNEVKQGLLSILS